MRATTASRTAPAHPESLSIYLAEIGRYPLLSATEERQLGELIKRGREAQRELEGDADLTEQQCRELAQRAAEAAEATRTFVTSNLRLVVSMARHYEASGLPLLDLIQEGNIGLMRAVAGFDHRRGFRFSTYASWAIRQAIVRGISNTGRLIRLPVHTGALIARIRRAQTAIEAEGVDHLMTDELARLVGTTPRRVREALAWERGPVSLSKPIGGAEDELGDLIADTSALSPLDQAVLSGDLQAMAKALAMLEEPEYRVLCLRFGLHDDDPTSIAEIGRRLGMSSEAARSIQVRAISKLRRSMRELEYAP
jgi:RNA polymerase sigma factor (sigma-70 family)